MVAGTQTARVLQEFETELKAEKNADEMNEHHEQRLSTQKAFQYHDVKNLASTISEMGNPFKVALYTILQRFEYDICINNVSVGKCFSHSTR